ERYIQRLICANSIRLTFVYRRYCLRRFYPTYRLFERCKYAMTTNSFPYVYFAWANIALLTYAKEMRVLEDFQSRHSISLRVNYPPLTSLAGCLKWGLLG